MSLEIFEEKFNKSIENTNFNKLSKLEREFFKKLSFKLNLSAQDLKQLIDISVDLNMWNEKSIIDITPKFEISDNKKQLKQRVFKQIKDAIEDLKYHKSYQDFDEKIKPQKINIIQKQKDEFGFGTCPVASDKTRCCNLLTLDAVESCGFDCSYCSIQSFYNQNTIVFHENFSQKLQNLKLNKDEIYHIGTGQSSDSLMWGNRYEILDALVLFAKNNPNIILELKSKSDNINYFLKEDIPKNIILTWSLNPQKIVDSEEHLTASLNQRLQAAKRASEKGIKIGFHFHPMVHFENWQQEYGEIFEYLIKNFNPKDVVLVSLGTLTFIKPVIKKIRKRDFKSKILQMPLVDSDGKLSYPKEIKLEMFKFAYQSFKKWHKEVFFYMCMENHSLWREVFGYEYPTNESFEMDMKLNYMSKIN